MILSTTIETERPTILIGIDDTDTLQHPGTNKLAMHLASMVNEFGWVSMITRHQLLLDDQVPYTRKNGCAAIVFHPNESFQSQRFVELLVSEITDWCPDGSDPGLCVAMKSPGNSVQQFGQSCQSELVTQQDATRVATENEILLLGLGGTNGGIIGALAAVGLRQTNNDGRVIYRNVQEANSIVELNSFNIFGLHNVNELISHGIDIVQTMNGNENIQTGIVDIGKRLRPNLRDGKVTLFISKSTIDDQLWIAERVT